MKPRPFLGFTGLCWIGLLLLRTALAIEPLPSWEDGPARTAILEFVTRVTLGGGADFVPPAERIAVFDNDGTLWSEKPVPFEIFFAFERVRKLAPGHPEWQDREPFASILKGDLKGVAASGEKGALELIAATHTGMTTDEFAAAVTAWLVQARHPQKNVAFTDLVYQPMLELLGFLRENGFKTYIVSGGGIEFMRPWAEKVYGVPPEQVIGSSGRLKYEFRDGVPVLLKLAEIDLIDDKAGKPAGIQSHIGRRPIAAFGNSDGDHEMLQWTMAGPGARFALLVHHDDAEREWAYDREDQLAKLSAAWDEAKAKGWTVVSMKNDWSIIHPARK